MKYVSPIYNNEMISTEDIMAPSPVVIVRNEIGGSGISYVDENGTEQTLTSGVVGNASTFFGKLY